MEKENNKRDRWLSYEEEEKLLKASPNWLQELIIFGVNTGMRLSEILSLSWKDVDLDRNTAIVMESKNREKRTIPFNQAALTLLKAKSKVRSIKTDLFFYSHAHTLIDKCNVGKVFRKVIKKAKIENLRFHDLRHTFATRLVQAGQDLYRVQLLLGHKTPFMTQRYAHHYPENLRSSVAALDTARKEFSTKLAQNKKVGANHDG
jgi:integrase